MEALHATVILDIHYASLDGEFARTLTNQDVYGGKPDG
jgi:hypothetical protein